MLPLPIQSAHVTLGSLCTIITLGCDTPPIPQVADFIAFAASAPWRPWRAGAWAVDGSDPPFGVPGTARRRSGCARPSQPRLGSLPVHQSHAGRPNGEPVRARPGLGRRGRTARRPAGRPTRPPPRRSGARHPSGTDCWLGVTPQRRGGWGCPAPSPLAPIEVCPRWGSLPATSRERGSASGLRWPWCNRKRASDMDDRGRVRPNGDFVSGDPQSEPDTQDLPPTPAFGAQKRVPRQTARTPPRGGRWR